ncbi:hypothetical protein LGM54_06180 [Burkholderia cenocepacia]|uniref:hypothetical protein n=1 Tax=Burkholderia cenocepacia TaxID=95486 RepID=UPI001CF55E15|nr:hypothetical protein [Burkholderia cenocepacia]MCA7962540.1 hypothetical protein [Burkholderia cenocepacia]
MNETNGSAADLSRAPRTDVAGGVRPAIEYRYEGGTFWCDLGPAEHMRSDFNGVYRLKAGEFPVWAGDGEPSADAAAAPESAIREQIARALHYPACWDTAAYPTLESAAWEAIAAAKLGCSACDAAPADAQAVEAVAWFSVAMNAAASLEDAANWLTDPDSKRAAEGAAAFARTRANELWASASEKAAELAERALLAAGQWADSNTPITEALAYRDGFIAGANVSTQAHPAACDHQWTWADGKCADCGMPAAPEQVAKPFAWIRASVPERLASPIAYSASTELLKNPKDGYLPAYLAPVQASKSAVLPSGYALVPIVPTKKMIDEAKRYTWIAEEDATESGIWRYMLAAAPPPAPASAPVGLTKEAVELFAADMVKRGELIWAGFRQDADEKYTIPELTPSVWKLIEALLKGDKQ